MDDETRLDWEDQLMDATPVDNPSPAIANEEVNRMSSASPHSFNEGIRW